MNLNKKHWNHTDYKEFQEFLMTKRNLKYQEFHSNLLKGREILGIRIPELKKIVKEIIWNFFLVILI